MLVLNWSHKVSCTKGGVESNLRGVHGQGDDSGDDRDEGSGGGEVLHVDWAALNEGGDKIRLDVGEKERRW